MANGQDLYSRRSYAEIVRLRMKTADNPTGAPLTIRDTANQLDYSYEHLRKVLAGEPVASKEFNTALCKLLGLDTDRMWEIAQLEKARHRFRDAAGAIAQDARLQKAWDQLTDVDRQHLLDTMEKLLRGTSADSPDGGLPLEREVSTQARSFLVTYSRTALVIGGTAGQAADAVLAKHGGAQIDRVAAVAGSVAMEQFREFEWLIAEPEEQGYDVPLTAREADLLAQILRVSADALSLSPEAHASLVEKLEEAGRHVSD
jgi:hypothetical protein